MDKCPKCGETELFQFTYDYSKAHRPVINILCNNCGEQFPPVLKLPKETLKQKLTLEEAAEKYSEGNDLEYAYVQEIPAFIAGAKWQAEKMYSEEDLRNAFDSAREFNSLDGVVDVHIVLPMGGDMSDLQPLHFTFKEWFEQFKKK
jgi:hypothetical protein